MFLSKNKKNNVYPCKPQFYYITVAFKGVKSYWCVFVMKSYVLHLYVLGAQLHARPIRNQEVAGSTPPSRQHSFVEI